MAISIVFNVSRVVSELGQVWLGEYMNRSGDLRTLARLHYGNHSFLSGLPYAFVMGDEVSYTTDREEEFKDSVLQVNVDLGEAHLAYIRGLLMEGDELSPLGNLLEEPPLNEKGESLLRGYQLHVVLKEAYADFTQTKEGLSKFHLSEDMVESLVLVKRGDERFISRKTEVNLSDALSVMFKKTSKDGGPVQGKEAVKSKLLEMMANRPSSKVRSLGIVSPNPLTRGQEPKVVSVERKSPLDILNQVNSSDL